MLEIHDAAHDDNCGDAGAVRGGRVAGGCAYRVGLHGCAAGEHAAVPAGLCDGQSFPERCVDGHGLLQLVVRDVQRRVRGVTGLFPVQLALQRDACAA